MCGSNNNNCEIKVTEVENGYQIDITGSSVKEALKPENLKKCIQTCCSGERCQ